MLSDCKMKVLRVNRAAWMDEFYGCIDNAELYDLSCEGTFYTWSNRREDNTILGMLDRAITNTLGLSPGI